jgi:hypothetical protein
LAKRPAQGRPMGFLMLFLSDCPGSLEGHRRMRDSVKDQPNQRYEERRDLRIAHSNDAHLKERKQ